MREIIKMIVVVSFALVAFVCPAFADTEIEPAIPRLRAVELDGHVFDLDSFKGKVVLIHFWATWCPSCREEMPILDAAYQKYHARGLEVIGVSADRSRARDAVVQAMKPLHFPTAMLDDVAVNSFGKPRLLPITYVVDRQGIVHDAIVPSEEDLLITTQDLDRILAKVL